MASLLSTRDSADRCTNHGRRHQRLCKQVVNDEVLSNNIQAPMDLVKSKVALLKQKVELREDAHDDVVLADNSLDDEVRTVFEVCKQYNRDNAAELVLNKIFPDEKFGDLLRLHFVKEVSEIEKMVLRLESLGAEHQLYPYVAKLNDKISTGIVALEAQSDAIRDEEMAEAEVAIAKETLISQYENNYLDARKKYGKDTAEKLFPKTRSSRKPKKPDESDTTDV